MERNPLIFLHIPKTAGTSFRTLLCNVFGDANLVELRSVNILETPAVLQALLASGSDSPKVVSGHIPMEVCENTSVAWTGFTILRDPIDRVVSLYTFLRQQSAAVLNGLELSENFTLAEMISSQNPEIYGQVNNGMCRFLSGLKSYYDAENPAFWSGQPGGELLLATLDRIGGLRKSDKLSLGLIEDQRNLLAAFRKISGAPFQLELPRENESRMRNKNFAPEILAQIAYRNADDIALYRLLSRELHEQVENEARCAADTENFNTATIFQPVVGSVYPVAQIPGRQGFFSAEPEGIAWLDNATSSRIYFDISDAISLFRMTFYRIHEDLPVSAIRFSLNHQDLPADLVSVRGKFIVLELDVKKARRRVNELVIRSQMAVPVQFVEPGSPDRRVLSVALQEIEVL